MTTQHDTALEGVKARIKATWASGDYPRIAHFTEGVAQEFIDRLRLKPGCKILDVACGNGNLAIPAAKAGAVVTGIDIAPNLLDQARERAVREGADIRFDEGDAEDLPYEAGAFDLVVSMFGAMFAPRPEVVASELCRVCRAGGHVAMANWTPSGFIGELFSVTGKHIMPPAGVPSPLLWGDKTIVSQRFAGLTSEIVTTVLFAPIHLPFTVPETVEFYRRHYGPTVKAFAALSEPGQAALQADMEDLYAQWNRATDGTTSVAAEYLEIVARRT